MRKRGVKSRDEGGEFKRRQPVCRGPLAHDAVFAEPVFANLVKLFCIESTAQARMHRIRGDNVVFLRRRGQIAAPIIYNDIQPVVG